MGKYRTWILLGLGIFFALGAGALTFVILQQQRLETAAEARRLALANQQGPTIKLPVAAKPLEPGQVIGTADYILKDFPVDLVPVAAITDTTALEQHILTSAIGQGETFRNDKFLGNSGATLSQQIEPGKVLVAFPIIDLLSQSNLVQDGDRIDLLITLQGTQDNEATKTTAVTLQNIQVFKVLRPAEGQGSEKTATAFLCSMTPENALLIKFIKDSGGTIDFVLRSSLDQEPHNVPPIDMQQLNQRFLSR